LQFTDAELFEKVEQVRERLESERTAYLEDYTIHRPSKKQQKSDEEVAEDEDDDEAQQLQEAIDTKVNKCMETINTQQLITKMLKLCDQLKCRCPQLALRRLAAGGGSLQDLNTFCHNASLIDLNAKDENPAKRKTALHYAFEKANFAAAKVLIAHGASFTIKDATEKLPVQCTPQYEQAYILQPLSVARLKQQYEAAMQQQIIHDRLLIHLLYHHYTSSPEQAQRVEYWIEQVVRTPSLAKCSKQMSDETDQMELVNILNTVQVEDLIAFLNKHF